MSDKRNTTDRLLNEAMDHIAGSLEQPSDPRAWDHLLIYCPVDALQRRIEELVRQGKEVRISVPIHTPIVFGAT